MVLSIILPIILLVLLGFACVKGGLMLSEQIKALGTFVIKIALPAFLLHALASRNLNEIWHPSYFIAYGGGSLLLFVCAFVLYRHYFQYRLTASAVMAMGASMSNTGFIGTAILTMLIGQHAAIYISLTLIIENLLIVALVLMIAEAGLQQQGSFKQIALPTLVNLLKNPVILAIIGGMSCVLFGLKLPAAIDQILAMLGKTASPLALFVIGGSLVGIGLKAVDIQSLILVSFKIVLMPLTIFLLLSVLPNVSQEMLYAGTVLAALPMPIAFGIFGQTYGLNEKALTPLMLSTVLGFGVVSGLIAFWWG